MKRLNGFVTAAAAACIAACLSVSVSAAEKITVAAYTSWQADILAKAAPVLAGEGYDLEVVQCEDYIQPDLMVASGEADANLFQHIPYLNRFNEENGTELVSAGGISYEPFGIYPGTKTSLDELAEGDVIAAANDAVNLGRALLLLQDNGIIALNEDAGLGAAKKDIIDNPVGVRIQALDAAQVFRMRGEAAFIVLDAKHALQAGFSPAEDAVVLESSDSLSAQVYGCVIAVQEGSENSDKIKALVDALRSDEIVSFICDTYDGAVLPLAAGEDISAEIISAYGDAWSAAEENADSTDTDAAGVSAEDKDNDGTAGDGADQAAAPGEGADDAGAGEDSDEDGLAG